MKKYNNSNQLTSNKIFNKVLLLSLIPLTLLSIIGFSGYTEAKTNSNKAKETITSGNFHYSRGFEKLAYKLLEINK